MIRGLFAFVAGAFAGGAIAAALMVAKTKELESRGNELAAALESRGTELEAYMISQGGQLEAELQRIGQMEAERSARKAADEYMATQYGLTPERIQSMSLLSQRLGIN